MTVLKDSFNSAKSIIIVILPILFALEILKYFEAIEPLSALLSPIVELLELPKEFGVVWVVALFTGVYGGIASFFYIAVNPENYTVDQVSILSALILIAHALPIEAKISQLLGVGYWKSMLFRFVASIIFAFLIKYFLDYFGLLQNEINLLAKTIHPQQETSTPFSMVINPIVVCIKVGVIIILLHFLIAILKKLRIIHYLEIMLKPLTYILRVDRRLSSSLLIGITLGISYGGALLTNDFNKLEKIDNREKVKAVYFLNLLHSLIEDTILVLLIGANIFIVLIGRILFSLFIVLLMGVSNIKQDSR